MSTAPILVILGGKGLRGDLGGGAHPERLLRVLHLLRKVNVRLPGAGFRIVGSQGEIPAPKSIFGGAGL